MGSRYLRHELKVFETRAQYVELNELNRTEKRWHEVGGKDDRLDGKLC